MTAGRSETATPPNPSPPTNFSSLGETPPTTPGLVPVSAGLPGESHLFAPATGGLEHECAGTEVVDPITGTVSTDGPPYVISPNSDHPSSGGAATGEQPAWVPADAVVHIDLVGGTPQGRAWVAGTGEVAVATLLGNDPVADAMWATTGYSSGDLTGDGCDPSLALGFIGPARTKIIAGTTMRVALKNSLYHPGYSYLVVISEDGGYGMDITASGDAIGCSSIGGSTNGNVADVVNIEIGEGNGIACTLTGFRLEAAANGNVTLLNKTLTTGDLPPGSPMVAAMMDCKLGVVVQSITLYDPLPSTAGLSDLSEVT